MSPKNLLTSTPKEKLFEMLNESKKILKFVSKNNKYRLFLEEKIEESYSFLFQNLKKNDQIPNPLSSDINFDFSLKVKKNYFSHQNLIFVEQGSIEESVWLITNEKMFVFDINSEKFISTIQHSSSITCVASNHGYLFSGLKDGSIDIWR
jgi:hypothetical protein